MREIGRNGVEQYLRDRVIAFGGLCEKHTSPGRKGVPDELVTWPDGTMHLVETKAPDGVLDGAQIRDHQRRKHCGVYVFVLWDKDEVDQYMYANRGRRRSANG